MPIVAPWSKVICPFCFRRFHLSEAHLRDTSTTAPAEADEHVKQFLGLATAPVMKRVVRQPTSFWRRFYVPWVQDDEWQKVCPRCHLDLPLPLARNELSGEVFAMVGGAGSGKSNYFGVLIPALGGRYLDEVGFTSFYGEPSYLVGGSDPQKKNSMELYRERYERYLYNRTSPQAVPQSASAVENPDIRIPLIYRMNFRRGWFDHFRNPMGSLRAMELVVFDAAGEDLADMVDDFYRYVSRATGIMFFIDPFGYPDIYNRLPPDLRPDLDDNQNWDPSHIVREVLRLFESRAGVSTTAKIKAPAAFVLSKCDLLEPIVPPGSLLVRDSDHEGGFNVEDCAAVSKEVEAFLDQCGGCRDLVNLARARFHCYAFFATSAFGCSPGSDNSLPKIQPRRIGDPLLWLLWKRGHIPARKGMQR